MQTEMTAIIINVRKRVFVRWPPIQISPLSSFVKRFVLNLLLSDVVRSSCANLLQHVKIKLVTVALVLEAGADRERTSASGWDPCASVRKHF